MKFKDLKPGDYIWIMDLEDETLIKSHPRRFQITKGLHTSEFEYQAVRFYIPEWNGDYELRIDNPESSLTLDDPYWVGSTAEEELQGIFNNPEKYGFKINV